ncbi:DUF3333 domain-containing protein, partial [Roseovarius indicus]|uniref:DUF3333 domain-containing protein n=1 Tax=Roseovarius indicus TaxID=540747 RepID=UPI003511821B
MTDATLNGSGPGKSSSLTARDARTKRRNASEKRFQAYGMIAIGIGLFFLVVLAFTKTVVDVEFTLSQEEIDSAESELFKTKAYQDLFISKL